MRFEGTIKSWNEAKGYGFISPTQGGQDIFVHISALPQGTKVPRPGQAFTFEIERNPDGKKRAVKVEHPGQSVRPARPNARTTRRKRPIIAVGGMLLIALIAGVVHKRFTGPVSEPAGPQSMSVPTAPTPATVAHTYRCDGRKRCPQMTSCSEAKFFLANCPGVEMDGNHDGVPCEQQWCSAEP